MFFLHSIIITHLHHFHGACLNTPLHEVDWEKWFYALQEDDTLIEHKTQSLASLLQSTQSFLHRRNHSETPINHHPHPYEPFVRDQEGHERVDLQGRIHWDSMDSEIEYRWEKRMKSQFGYPSDSQQQQEEELHCLHWSVYFSTHAISRLQDYHRIESKYHSLLRRTTTSIRRIEYEIVITCVSISK